MGLIMKDLEGKMSQEEYQSRLDWITRTKSNDVWAKKIFNKVGILMTGHQANRPYMKACIESHKKLDLWITVAYDNFVDPTWDKLDYNAFMPAKDVMENIDTFIMPHHQVWGGCLYPYFWLLKFGVASMQNFEYIYCTNTDFVLEKPEGFQQLFDLLGDADIMTSGPDYDDGPNYAANTAGFICKSKALSAIVQHLQDHFIPWDVYEKYTLDIGNAEGRFGRAIKDLGLRKIVVDPPNEDMFKVPGKGTWYDLIGFRHIHAELNHAYRYRTIPPPLRYLDERYAAGNDIAALREYEKTGDIKYLENWWMKE